MNLRPATRARVRVWWQLWCAMWGRIGEVHADVTTAASEEERWARVWRWDQRGRHISYPWRDRR